MSDKPIKMAYRGSGKVVHAIGTGGQLCGAGVNTIGTRRTKHLHYTNEPVSCKACLTALDALKKAQS